MTQENKRQNKKNWDRKYRHMNLNSLADLSAKMNQRVVLHLFADSIQPDLLFREVQTCLKVCESLQYALIESEVYRAFNACQNVEEAEVLRDKLADNMDRVTSYLQSKSYKKRVQRAAQEQEQEDLLKTEQALYALWDKMNALLFSQNEVPPQPQWAAPKQKKKTEQAPEPSWLKYERKLDDQPPAAEQIPELPDQKPSVPAREEKQENIIQVSESSLMSVVSVLSMALIVFGAITALSSILQKSLSFIEILIYGSIWGLCIVNLLFLFVYYSARLLKADIRDDKDPQATVFEKYSMIFWADLILAEVLIFCLWLYLFREMVSYAWIIKAFHSMPSFFLITGTIVLLYLFYRAFVWLKAKTFGSGEAYASTKEEMSLLSRQVRKGCKSTRAKIRESRKRRAERARQKEAAEKKQSADSLIDDLMKPEEPSQ